MKIVQSSSAHSCFYGIAVLFRILNALSLVKSSCLDVFQVEYAVNMFEAACSSGAAEISQKLYGIFNKLPRAAVFINVPLSPYILHIHITNSLFYFWVKTT